MEEPSLEALMQAGLIFVVGVAIILSNLLIIATYLNFRGKSSQSPLCTRVFNVTFVMLTLVAARPSERVLAARIASVPFV